MAFRKRNVALSGSSAPKGGETSTSTVTARKGIPGVRASPIDGRPTTSTGVPSLDGILAGHAGLAMGTSLLIEESGTTDYSGALLRYYAAEGIIQGHNIHLLGMGEQWTRELPGYVGSVDVQEGGGRRVDAQGRMKIAWRYERLGEFGAASGSSVSRSRAQAPAGDSQVMSEDPVLAESASFCHIFDLTKRLELPANASIDYLPIDTTSGHQSPFGCALQTLLSRLESSPRDSIHRFVVPTILSPALYPPHACLPQNILSFCHGLRALLRRFPRKLTALITLPLELYPRKLGVVRWVELLSDGVLELTPFPHISQAQVAMSISGAATAQESPPQGMVKVHTLPVFHERGGGGGGLKDLGDDLAFTLSRRKFVIRPYSLPPPEGDTEAQQSNASAASGKPSKGQMEF